MLKQAIYGIIFNPERTEVLLVERRDVPVWVLPGGGLDPGESPEEGALREVEEETGYKVVITKKIAQYLPVNRLTQQTHFFECSIVGGAPTVNAEAKRIAFFPLSALPKTLAPPFPEWIADAMRGHGTVIVKNIEGVTYTRLVTLLLRHPYLVMRYLLTKLGIRFNDRA